MPATFSLYDTLDRLSRGAIADAKAIDIETLTNWIVMARPSMKSLASGIAAKIRDSKVETMSWEGNVLTAITAGSYVSFSADANKFALWEASQGVGGTVGVNNAGSNQLDIATWAALYYNHDAVQPTIDQMMNLGKVFIQYGEQQRPNRLWLLRDFMVQRIEKDYRLSAAVSEVNAYMRMAGNSGLIGGFKFDPQEPMIVTTSDSRPLLQISGLSGAATGPLTLQLHVKGYRIRL